MTPAGFPHSDTFGSKPWRRLPEAFRSLTRPSSAPGAKASTVSPLQLDRLDARARYGVLKVHAPDTREEALRGLLRTEVRGSRARTLRTGQCARPASRRVRFPFHSRSPGRTRRSVLGDLPAE